MTVTLERLVSRTNTTAKDELPAALRATLNQIAVGGHVTANQFASAMVQTAELRGGVKDIALATLMAARLSGSTGGRTRPTFAVTWTSAGDAGRRRSSYLLTGCRRRLGRWHLDPPQPASSVGLDEICAACRTNVPQLQV